MSGGRACRCAEGTYNKVKWWRILQYRSNTSAFNGYRKTPSDYSSIRCTACGAVWRTKADYVESLPFLDEHHGGSH